MLATTVPDGTSNIVHSMKKNNLTKISVVTSVGTGDSISQAPWKFKLLIYTVMRKVMKDKNNQEQLFLDVKSGIGRDLAWTIVRPGGLGEGPPTGVVNVIDGVAGSIHRSDVAIFLLDAMLTSKFVKRSVCISSVGGTGWVKESGFDKPGEL